MSTEDKSEAILRAALELFNERGFHGTPVPLIAEKAGVGAGTIYRSFASKEVLVNALYQRWKKAMLATMMQDFPFEAPPREQFRVVWERMADFALKHPNEVAFLELHHHRPYLDDESRSIESGVMELGVQLVRRAQEQRVVKSLDATVLIELANGAFLGLFRAMVEGRVEMKRAIFMHAEQCCWEAIRA